MAREMIDNEQSTAITPSEAVEEKVSLSDRSAYGLVFTELTKRHILPWSMAMLTRLA